METLMGVINSKLLRDELWRSIDKQIGEEVEFQRIWGESITAAFEGKIVNELINNSWERLKNKKGR